jgi:cytochrome c
LPPVPRDFDCALDFDQKRRAAAVLAFRGAGEQAFLAAKDRTAWVEGPMKIYVAASWLAFAVAVAPAAAADVGAGEKVFQKCMQCHRIGLGATNFYGPVLNGLEGRKAGTVPGFKYSPALENSDIVWSYETLSRYLRQPKHEVPGVAMTFPGLKDQADIDNVIAYIQQFRRDGGKD